ncbi:MAG TPA: choice-of-anchor Q domain-containing protein, partial [Anaerolineales bacterium]|nr:choice-of-anchor Q domain-containing protein [Anaerolineales bacterium]
MNFIKSMKVELMFLVVALFIGFVANINPAYGYDGNALTYPYPSPSPYPGPDPVTYYVKWDATGANNGSSWTDAYTNLQDALSAASVGDEIWVATGTYYPTSNIFYPSPGTDRTVSFELKNGVAIYGGFIGTEALFSERDPVANLTVLSGDLNGDDNGFTNNDENSYHVVVGSGTDSTAVLNGFTVRGGNANGSFPNNDGGGMYNDGGSPTVANVTFSGNFALFGGGMLNHNGSSPTVTNVIFSDNTAIYGGGGLFNAGSSVPTLSNVTFINNSADAGGGMANDGSSPIVTNVTFSDNTVTTSGGGMYNYNSSPIVTNVTFSSNTATYDGGGMVNDGSSPVLMNVTFSGNSAAISGGGMINFSVSSPVLTNVIIANSANGGDCVNYGADVLDASSSNNLVEDGTNACGLTNGVNGNVVGSDPMLGALTNNGGSTLTFALLPGSPAIDVGDDGVCPATDQRGVTRPQGDSCDIGAYEYEGSTSANIEVRIGGDLQASYADVTDYKLDSYKGVNGGPLRIKELNVNLLASSIRLLYRNHRTETLSELMGVPDSQLAGDYWLPLYIDNSVYDTQLRFTNTSDSLTTTVNVY